MIAKSDLRNVTDGLEALKHGFQDVTEQSKQKNHKFVDPIKQRALEKKLEKDCSLVKYFQK
jgi:hypothetical protein